MIRLIGKRGHVSRRHVEQVLHTPRAVGHTAPGGTLPIDDGDAQGALAETCEVHCRHHAAETTADDGNAEIRRNRVHFWADCPCFLCPSSTYFSIGITVPTPFKCKPSSSPPP